MKPTLTLLTALLLVPLVALHAAEPRTVAPVVPGQRVLVTGHSFHVPVAPLIEQVVKAAQITGHQLVGGQIIGGSRVMQHWNLPDEKNIAKTVLRAGGVDVMTMSPNWIVPDEAIEHFVTLGLERNPKLRVMVQVSWYPWDGLKPPQKVAKNEDRDAKTVADLRAVYDPYRDTIRTQLRAINARHARPVVFLVPVGEAVLRLREKVIAGKAPGITRQSELFGDQIGHGKPPILQLAAYCHFACIYHRNPVGLACFEKPGNDESHKLNHLLQTIAWDAVRDEPLAGLPIAAPSLKKP
ncbi:MAG: hypothetical protein FJ388_08040 [Verrucomicrobia bacterium]|nr:hypothetical protein [Verrucomicrobiota bacterium]